MEGGKVKRWWRDLKGGVEVKENEYTPTGAIKLCQCTASVPIIPVVTGTYQKQAG